MIKQCLFQNLRRHYFVTSVQQATKVKKCIDKIKNDVIITKCSFIKNPNLWCNRELEYKTIIYQTSI